TKTDYWKMDQPHSPHLFMMAIGEFAIVKDHWSSTNKQIEVNYYLEPSHEDYAKQIFGNTPKMLSFFSNRLGYEFPWPKYSQVIVRDFVTGAMENTTASVFMESLQMDHRELEDVNWDYIIAHELMHHWFGDLVTCESWSNLPLNEAFANYGEYLWLEHEYGLEEAEHHGFQELEKYLEEAETKQVDLIRFDYDDNEDMFDEHSYAKGGRILHMLRKYVGDEAFFQSLKYYLNTHEFSSVEVHDLRLAFEHITGEDLNWFFDQWFFASGHPQLQVTHSYDSGQLLVTVAQLQDLETTPLYRLPLYLDVWIGENYYRYPLEIIHQYEEFEIDLGQAPDLVLFDGDQQLLAEIDHEKSWQELINQYYYSDQFLARYESIFLISDLPQDSLFRRVLWDAMQDPSWVIREASISAFQNYEGTEIEEITRRIREAYMSDPKSVVRSAAVDVLSSIDVNSFKEIYRTGMKDLSYAVVGSSLDAYLKTGEKDKMEVISKFLDYKSIAILIPIADYFSTNQMTDQIPWIEEKMKYLNGLDLWYMLQYFGALSMEAPDKYQQLSISTLEKYAITHPQSFIRLAAVQGLSLLSDTPGVDTLIKEIKGQERDPELRVIYEQF
ncbi:MAG: M1 family aminopeptidase, partial [Bacteroidetes bacterium]|nr:M1 family aminopeptidase [Bacteroidota bacterium]